MNRKILLLLCMLGVALHLSAQVAGGDARSVVRSTMYGVGAVNLYDTYLSPMEYTGTQFRVLRESVRPTRWFDNRVSRQTIFQGYMGVATNPAETADELAGMVNWNYALHYNFALLDGRLRLAAGPMLQLHGGFLYNTRNSNNPAQAKLYANLAASGMAQYDMLLGAFSLRFRYQLDVPFMGVMFSPQYGQSYYEIFSLGHSDGTVHFTSLHNQPTMRHLLTTDITIRRFSFRVGYMADMQQARVGGLRTHDYSHTFMIGLVKKLIPL